MTFLSYMARAAVFSFLFVLAAAIFTSCDSTPAQQQRILSPTFTPTVEVQATMTSATLATVTPAPSIPLVPDWRFVSLDYRITESNDSWSKFSWKLVARNDSDVPILTDVTIQFLDADGFVVEEDYEYDVLLDPHSERTITDYDLIDAAVAPTVANIYAEAN